MFFFYNLPKSTPTPCVLSCQASYCVYLLKRPITTGKPLTTIVEERRGANWDISEQKQALPFILGHYQESTVRNMGGEQARVVGEEASETKVLVKSL